MRERARNLSRSRVRRMHGGIMSAFASGERRLGARFSGSPPLQASTLVARNIISILPALGTRATTTTTNAPRSGQPEVMSSVSMFAGHAPPPPPPRQPNADIVPLLVDTCRFSTYPLVELLLLPSRPTTHQSTHDRYGIDGTK